MRRSGLGWRSRQRGEGGDERFAAAPHWTHDAARRRFFKYSPFLGVIEVLAAISWAAKATHDFIARFRPEHDVDRTPRVAVARRRRGRARQDVNVRAVINGLMYVLSTGCQWRALPKDLPPRSTVYDYFDLWSWDGRACSSPSSPGAITTRGARSAFCCSSTCAPPQRSPSASARSAFWTFGHGEMWSHGPAGAAADAVTSCRQSSTHEPSAFLWATAANSAAWVGEGVILCVRLRRPDRDALIDRSLDQLAS